MLFSSAFEASTHYAHVVGVLSKSKLLTQVGYEFIMTLICHVSMLLPNPREEHLSSVFLYSILTLSCLFWLQKLLTIFRKGKSRLPPGPRGLPVVGYLPFLGRNLHKFFMELAREYGPIYKLSLGAKLFVIVSSPTIAKEIVRDLDVVFANRNPRKASLAFSYGGKDIAFAPLGPQWRMLRRLFVHEMQSAANLDAFCSHRRREVMKSARDLCGRTGLPVKIGEVVFHTVFNMITCMFWGGTLGVKEAARIGAEFREAVARFTVLMAKPNVSDFFPLIARFDVQGVEREMKEVVAWIGRILDFVISQHMSLEEVRADKGCEKRDFLQILLEYKDEETGRVISPEQMKALLMDIFLGGTDTTYTMVEWTMTELLLHPEVLLKVQKELDDIVGPNNMVEESHIHKLNYLHVVVKETLRLHPAGPLLLPRSPSQTCTVGGYTIPEGTTVFLNVWAMHRDPQFWPDPSKFRPERFSVGGEAFELEYSGRNLHYMPFGSGRGVCAGLQLGERMLMYVLATFLHLFEWRLPPGMELDCEEKFGMVLEKATPLIAIATPRVPNLHLLVKE
ncbi:labd-13Z-ene-9,15,16-triol synthase, chloroplastic-like [Syzygium oleosum]|uniref:labd-13Z-ene-9,15,16-triol synthase, chloroplastic-like n=1 Tax=Syzygium oleosum TaxID=219896 RepID=UPI0024BB6DA7|nr:labd-13Z-ene-9,15,16-triol synthase, chloroplastic-like [Syzygium oleosum]